MPDTWAVEGAGLGKRFGGVAALRGVDVRVAPGERVALLGSNGAGKTTLLRVLALLARPTAGRLCLFGHASERSSHDLRRLVGYVGHHSALYPDLTVREHLVFHARLYGVPGAAGRIEAAMEQLGLTDRRDRRAGALSRGLQQRLALARALLHDPPLLLLDEPETGLDAAGLALLGDLLAAAGRTVILSTHRAEHARRFCSREILLDRGRVALDGPAAVLRQTGAGE